MFGSPLINSYRAWVMPDLSDSNKIAFSLRICGSFEEAEPVWRLLESAGDALVFQSYDWQSAHYKAIGHKHLFQLCIVIVETKDNRPLMLLPFGIVRRPFSRVLTWLGGRLTDYNGPILASEAARLFDQRRTDALWQEICRELPSFDYTDFQRQPAEIGNQPNPFWQLGTYVNPLYGWQTRLSSDWTAYYQRKRSGQTRRKERKKEEKLGQHGPIDFFIAQTEEEIDVAVAALVAQKSASYTLKGVKCLFRDEAYVDFIKDYTLTHARSGLVVLAGIRVRNEIIATQWGLIRGGHFCCLVLSRDHGRFARYSPGNILLRRLLEWCCGRDIKIFDFTYGNEAFKDHWCDSKIELYDSYLPVTFRGRLIVGGIALLNSMQRLLRRSSRVHAFATTLRKQWYNTRSATSVSGNLGRAEGYSDVAPRLERNASSGWNKA